MFHGHTTKKNSENIPPTIQSAEQQLNNAYNNKDTIVPVAMEVSSTFLNPIQVYTISISFTVQPLHPLANNHPLRTGYKDECTAQLVCNL